MVNNRYKHGKLIGGHMINIAVDMRVYLGARLRRRLGERNQRRGRRGQIDGRRRRRRMRGHGGGDQRVRREVRRVNQRLGRGRSGSVEVGVDVEHRACEQTHKYME